jgi:hypothetical protein
MLTITDASHSFGTLPTAHSLSNAVLGRINTWLGERAETKSSAIAHAGAWHGMDGRTMTDIGINPAFVLAAELGSSAAEESSTVRLA